MDNIYLIGDSIRFGSVSSPGYELFLREKLKGKCSVHSPDENCRFAQYTLRGLCDWVNHVNAENIDFVHWNNGLWDVLRLNGDEPLTPIDCYVYMLKRVYKKIRLFFPNAKVIFAVTTPVVEKNSPPGWERCNSEIEKYNDAAKNLMDKLGVKVNDLYSVAKKFDESYYADWTHLNEKGARILADEIIKSLKGHKQ